jgi:hypothetical protein
LKSRFATAVPELRKTGEHEKREAKVKAQAKTDSKYLSLFQIVLWFDAVNGILGIPAGSISSVRTGGRV